MRTERECKEVFVRFRVLAIAIMAGMLMFWGSASGAIELSASKSTASASMAEVLKPEVEVSSESWPIRLTMRLLETRLHLGENPWYQLTLTHIGDVQFWVTPFVLDPTQVRHNGKGKKFVYFELIGPDGESVDFAFLGRETVFDDPPDTEIPGIFQPGETRATLPWAYNPYDWGHKPESPGPAPRGQYSELPFYDLSKPGKYKIRAVYDRVFPDDRKTPKQLRREGDVRVVTPWIRFSVTR